MVAHFPPTPWVEGFLAALREMPVYQHACDVVGVDRTTVFRKRKDDPDFADAVADAMEAGIDRAEQEAIRRGVTGWNEPVVYQGQFTPVYKRDEQGELVYAPTTVRLRDAKTGKYTGETRIDQRPVQEIDAKGKPVWVTVNKRSDAMLALVLKGRRKQVYAERTEITGADGGPLAHSDETTRAARIARLVEQAALRKAADELG